MVLFTNDNKRNMMRHNMKYQVYIMNRCHILFKQQDLHTIHEHVTPFRDCNNFFNLREIVHELTFYLERSIMLQIHYNILYFT